MHVARLIAVAIVAIVTSSLAGVAAAQTCPAIPPTCSTTGTVSPISYWLMPANRRETIMNVHQSGGPPYPGTKAHWRGTMSGWTVALQDANNPFPTYDVFTVEPTRMRYWATFLGNAFPPTGQDSHVFLSPYTFLNSSMTIGIAISQTITDRLYKADLRKVTSPTPWTFRTIVNASCPTWTDSKTGIVWSDVLHMSFWPGYQGAQNPNSHREDYFLAKNYGWVHFCTPGTEHDPKEAWVSAVGSYTQMAQTFPWFDPFQNTNFVPNGFFEDVPGAPAGGGGINDYLVSWVTNDNTRGRITKDFPLSSTGGPWRIALTQGAVVWAHPVACIPVTPGGRYTLSGWIYRGSSQDAAYLDFNDGQACTGTGSFTDQAAASTAVGTWQLRQATVTIPAGMTGIRIRAVHDGMVVSNAYFDGVMLQRVQ